MTDGPLACAVAGMLVSMTNGILAYVAAGVLVRTCL